jgi:transcriptional/translational regulatory protein YebC/TACO1
VGHVSGTVEDGSLARVTKLALAFFRENERHVSKSQLSNEAVSRFFLSFNKNLESSMRMVERLYNVDDGQFRFHAINLS